MNQNVQCWDCRTVYHEDHGRCPWCGSVSFNGITMRNTCRFFPQHPDGRLAQSGYPKVKIRGGCSDEGHTDSG